MARLRRYVSELKEGFMLFASPQFWRELARRMRDGLEALPAELSEGRRKMRYAVRLRRRFAPEDERAMMERIRDRRAG